MAENERGQRSVTESDGKCFWRGRWAQNLAKLLRFSDAEAVGVFSKSDFSRIILGGLILRE
jgi:hypothetical protein